MCNVGNAQYFVAKLRTRIGWQFYAANIAVKWFLSGRETRGSRIFSRAREGVCVSQSCIVSEYHTLY